MRCDLSDITRFVFVCAQCLGSAAVAQTVIGPDLSTLPWMQICIGAALALWGGLTRTAERFLANQRLDQPQPMHLPQELLKDVLVSSGIGFLIYVVGSARQWDVWLLGAGLWTGGYLGSVVLSTVGTRALEWLRGGKT